MDEFECFHTFVPPACGTVQKERLRTDLLITLITSKISPLLPRTAAPHRAIVSFAVGSLQPAVQNQGQIPLEPAASSLPPQQTVWQRELESRISASLAVKAQDECQLCAVLVTALLLNQHLCF